MADDKPTVTIAVEGEVTSAGELHGTGTLEVQISDASKAAVTLDYSTPDRVTVTIASEVGFSVQSRDVTLAGSAGVTPIDRTWSATGSIKLDVSKSVAMTMQQTFGSAGPSTSLGVSIRF